MRTQSRVARAIVAVAIAAVARIALAANAPVYVISIPAEDLGTALLEFAAVTHEQIAFDGKLVERYRSTALSGTYTVAQGLHSMLGTAPLLIDTTSSGVLAVVPAYLTVAATDKAPVTAPQKSLPASSEEAKQGVTITAQRAELRRRISTFVNQLTAFDPADPLLGLARWQDPVCPLVSGLTSKAGEFVLARITEVARDAGVPLAGEKCRPSLFVLVSPQTAPLLRAMEKRRLEFTFGGASQPLIDAFIEDPRPIKVWYLTTERTPEGLPLVGYSMPDRNELKSKNGAYVQNADINSSDNPAPTNPWSEPSRLGLNAVGVIYRVFVIVDQTKLRGANLGQISDYVSLVGLSQIKPEANLGGAPTILALFAGEPRTAQPGMSDWDRGFLRSLYHTPQATVMQRRDIALEMQRAILPR